MIQAKLSSKFQRPLPKALRESLHLEPGQRFTLVTRGNIIELIPRNQSKAPEECSLPVNTGIEKRERSAPNTRLFFNTIKRSQEP